MHNDSATAVSRPEITHAWSLAGRAAVAAAAVILVVVMVHRVLETPLWNNNGSRLMPSFALAHGLDYYVLIPPGGPLYSSLYGPVVALAYVPATWLPSPNSAVLAGSTITVLLCFASLWLMHVAPFGRARDPLDTAAFLAAAYLACYIEPLKYSCFDIHADGPGLALGGLACAALYPGARDRWRAALPVSALAAVLTVAAKEPFVAVPFALMAYLWIVAGRRQALVYGAWVAAAGGLVGGLAAAVAGPANLYHCLLWIPLHHPWNYGSHLVSAIQAGRALIRFAMPVPALLVAGLMYLWLAGPGIGVPIGRVLKDSRSLPLLLTGTFLLPFSIMGRAKVGGDINSLSFTLFFLACGLTVLVSEAGRMLPEVTGRTVSIALLVAIALPIAASEAPLSLDIPASGRRLAQAPQEIALRYLRGHPGEAYFPWFPISHYYAEHQFRHQAFGIADRLLAGETIPEPEFRAYIPPNARYVAFSADGTPGVFGFDLMKFLPEYRYTVTIPELPGWLVYAKEPAR